MRKLLLIGLLAANTSLAQTNSAAIVDGRMVEVDKITYNRNEHHDGFGYFAYTPEGILRFFKHGFVTEFGPNEGDYRKGNYIDDKLEGEGEEVYGDVKYEGNYSNDRYNGIGKLTNLKTSRNLYGYFSDGKFVRPIRSYGPYLCPCIFRTSNEAVSRFVDVYEGGPNPFRTAP